MALQVAPCPRCRGAIVLGERMCRACGQPFDYGAQPPPLPQPRDVWDALAAVGQVPADPAAQQALAQSIQQSFMRASQAGAVAHAPPPQTAPASAAPAARPGEPPVARLAELDTGRFEAPAAVPVEEVPGLVDSTLFAALTPRDVQVARIEGLEQTAMADVGEVPVVRAPDVDHLNAPVGDVPVQLVPDVFHSDFMKAPEGIQTQRLDVIESSPGAFVERKKKPAAGKGKVVELSRVVCRCGEIHRLAHCPSCGTAHPELA